MATPLEWAYLAGLFDGEGSISIGKRAIKKYPGVFSYRLEMLLTNTHLDSLYRIQKEIGGYVYVRKLVEPRRKPLGYIRWENTRAVEILNELLPYLKIKLAHAKLAIDFVQTKTRTRLDGLKHVPQGMLEHFRREMLDLNGNMHRR